uniref:Uncharacterized protein n=1 Tax=Acrobeloides nanus TaxID=290746 RepID=A0A914E777_9BILA
MKSFTYFAVIVFAMTTIVINCQETSSSTSNPITTSGIVGSTTLLPLNNATICTTSGASIVLVLECNDSTTPNVSTMGMVDNNFVINPSCNEGAITALTSQGRRKRQAITQNTAIFQYTTGNSQIITTQDSDYDDRKKRDAVTQITVNVTDVTDSSNSTFTSTDTTSSSTLQSAIISTSTSPIPVTAMSASGRRKRQQPVIPENYADYYDLGNTFYNNEGAIQNNY